MGESQDGCTMIKVYSSLFFELCCCQLIVKLLLKCCQNNHNWGSFWNGGWGLPNTVIQNRASIERLDYASDVVRFRSPRQKEVVQWPILCAMRKSTFISFVSSSVYLVDGSWIRLCIKVIQPHDVNTYTVMIYKKNYFELSGKLFYCNWKVLLHHGRHA